MTLLESFQPVPLDVLRLDQIAGFDIYIRVDPEKPLVLYREKALPFTRGTRARLVKNGVRRVYIHVDQQQEYRQYVERNLGAILADPRLEPSEKGGVLYNSVTGLIEDTLKEPRAPEVVPRSKEMVRNTCKYLFEQKGALEHLMRVSSFDYYTYTHSVNVFVFSLSLFGRVYFRDDDLMDFGLGALLHDIGKSAVDPAVTSCKGKLTPGQFEEMKKHTIYGHQILTEHGSVGSIPLDVTLHHHEKLDGSGYPDGLKGDEITEFARMVTIADIFDALTTRRTYKDAMNSYPALAFMKNEMGHHLDARLYETFVLMMGHPAGAPKLKVRHMV